MRKPFQFSSTKRLENGSMRMRNEERNIRLHVLINKIALDHRKLFNILCN
ncbi:hypothetical protein DCAR_0729636 [Daucus carota subsp. sativus]|uniref:Uncharacterized protein n=1 Tax=Daucus carota subsp. sativus TaxID=79200 RepID=A0A164UCP3_DAUCS|nr:hypothetical protein DCAR_0729636 [Daucus carota subsp. sativus]